MFKASTNIQKSNSPLRKFCRKVRLALHEKDKAYSLRQVALRVGIEPAYLSKIERGDFAPPSEAVIVKLAAELNENPDVLLAMAGKLSSDLQEIIRRRTGRSLAG